MLSLQFAIYKSFKSTTRCFLLNRTLPIRTMKIYTKTGDKGTSALWTGERFDKNNHIFESLGSIDELNAHLGLVSPYLLSINGSRIICFGFSISILRVFWNYRLKIICLVSIDLIGV